MNAAVLLRANPGVERDLHPCVNRQFQYVHFDSPSERVCIFITTRRACSWEPRVVDVQLARHRRGRASAVSSREEKRTTHHRRGGKRKSRNRRRAMHLLREHSALHRACHPYSASNERFFLTRPPAQTTCRRATAAIADSHSFLSPRPSLRGNFRISQLATRAHIACSLDSRFLVF